MAASGAPVRQPRRGPAPIASFDHDVSDEVRQPSSPESKQTFQLPEIREDPAGTSPGRASPASGGDGGSGGGGGGSGGGGGLVAGEPRARSASTPAVHALSTPSAPRIDISRASSSSHQDSRDSSPELALFAGGADDARTQRLDLGFREDGALELRSSTEELAFLEPAERPPAPPPVRRHSRKDSQGSEAALLAVSGRTSRLSSVGSQCSAHSALSGLSHASRVSRLSVVSGVSRSPSPHKMLLETSFCGPKPIETDPEICAAAVEERLLEMAKLTSAGAPTPTAAVVTPLPVAVSPPQPAPPVQVVPPAPAGGDARDRREVRTEATVEAAPRPSAPVAPAHPAPAKPAAPPPDDDKLRKENRNRARAEERRTKPKLRREPSEPEVYKSVNRTKDIIRIKLKPDNDYEEEDESEVASSGGEALRKPATLELSGPPARPVSRAGPACVTPAPAPAPASCAASPTPSRRRVSRESRTPSPAGPPVSRKSSFCSLFKSRETIASPDSPSEALRRKKSLNEGRSRSRSRDRSATPTSATKIRGSVLSLFRTPRRSATSPSPSSRDASPGVTPRAPPAERPRPRAEHLKYYEDTKDGIIHIPLRTPPDERPGSEAARRSEGEVEAIVSSRGPARPASAPQPRSSPDAPVRPSAAPDPVFVAAPVPVPAKPSKPTQRTVLPDGSIIIPLHSPTEKVSGGDFSSEATTEPVAEKHRAVVEVARAASPPAAVPGVDVSPPHPDKHPPAPAPAIEDRRNVEVSPPTEVTPPERTPSTETRDERDRSRRRERLVFTTHVGSREQVFSTQFSITKTPSVTSEISESAPSFPDSEEFRPPPLRDTHITHEGEVTPASTGAGPAGSGAGTPQEGARDSSESEPSSEAAPARAGNDVEQRGLVVQESFEEELPYVPTTLPLERSLALPMVPVRERGGVRVAGVERPRGLTGASSGRGVSAPGPAALPAPRPPPPRPGPPPAAASPAPPPLHIKLPRRPRASSASSRPRDQRPRTRSGGDGGEPRPKADWIDFEDVPERRKQPKRIQTLPAGVASVAGVTSAASVAGSGGGREAVVFSYVEPEHCRCECHHARHDDELPLLVDDADTPGALRVSSSSLEGGEEEAQLELSVQIARPFTADLDLRHDHHHDKDTSPSPGSTRPH